MLAWEVVFYGATSLGTFELKTTASYNELKMRCCVVSSECEENRTWIISLGCVELLIKLAELLPLLESNVGVRRTLKQKCDGQSE